MAQMEIDVRCEDGDFYENQHAVVVVEVKVYPPNAPIVTFDGKEDVELSRRLKPGFKTRVTLRADDEYELRINSVTAKVSPAEGTRIDLEL